MRAPIAPTGHPKGYPPTTVGFCVNREGEAALKASGVEKVWMRGRGMESLDWALSYLRGRNGVLAVADDLRIFGPTRKEMFARMAALARAKVILRDILRPDLNAHELEERTLSIINAAKGMRNHRTARRRGRLGGRGKGIAAWRARDEVAPRDLIERMVAELGAKKTAALLLNKISEASLRRHYAMKLEA